LRQRPRRDGTVITALHLSSGAAGPLLDVFCLHSALNRHQNVATKAAVQSIGHTLKILYFAVIGGAVDLSFSWGTLALASVAGTWLGRKALDRMTEANFRRATRALVCAIGLFSLARAVWS
jgi:uncharacterized membrane protein YfcA